MKNPSLNKMIKQKALERLKKMGYSYNVARQILAKSFRELRERYLKNLGGEQ